MRYTRCDVTAAQISRAGKNARGQYPWVKYRGALQYRQGMTAFPPPPAGQGGVMMLPATGRRTHELSGMTGYTKLALHYRKSHKQTTATAYHTVGSTKERGFGGEKIDVTPKNWTD